MTQESQSQSEAEKLKKRQDKERRREAEAVKKKLLKTVKQQQKPKPKEDSKDPLAKPELQEANRPRKDKAQDRQKKDDKKLAEASRARRDAIKKKPKPKSPKDKAEAKVKEDEKRARLAEHLKQKATSRASLDKQKANLKAEVKALNKLSEVRETVDGQYTARFSGFESAIAAGPMGATSTGLRKLSPSIYLNIKRAEAGAKVQNKIDPKVSQQLQKIKKVARDLKLSDFKELSWAKVSKVQAVKEVVATEQKVEHSKLRSKIKEIKLKERMRDPNRDPSKFDELNMPLRGVGGTGGV
jgi:hypothetical protein